MNRTLFILAVCLVLLSFSQFGYAEDYKECKARCNQEFAACMGNNLENSEPQQPAVARAACEENLQVCYAGCKEIQQESGNNVEKGMLLTATLQ